MTPEEQAGWDYLDRCARSAARNDPKVGGDRPCSDCTAEYATVMGTLGLCIGFPGPQRYCRRCLKWWPVGLRYWARYTRRERMPVCLFCRGEARRVTLEGWVKDNPPRWMSREEASAWLVADRGRSRERARQQRARRAAARATT